MDLRALAHVWEVKSSAKKKVWEVQSETTRNPAIEKVEIKSSSNQVPQIPMSTLGP